MKILPLKITQFILCLVILIYAVTTPAFAQQFEQFEAKIISIGPSEFSPETGISTQNIQLLPSNGKLKDRTIEIDHPVTPSKPTFKTGDKVVVDVSGDFQGGEVYYISDYVRRTPLYLLFTLFIGMVLFFARKKGLQSLVGMGLSFAAIFYVLLPFISQGYNPLVSTLLTALTILPVTFYISHGFNKTTHAAALSTLITLLIIIIIMAIFIESTKLTGFASEEASFIKQMRGDEINIKGLLYAGVLIAIIGVLDDITIAQSSLVSRLKEASEKLTDKQLYLHAMEVGKDHIASLVNTLVLVYTGASLPLLLLFTNSHTTFFQVINYEVVAEELVRILIASIGLIAAVPISTLIAVKMISGKNKF